MIALSLGSFAPALIAAAPGAIAMIATTAPGAPTLLPGLVTALSAFG
ncbi:hypothetical protein [Nioella sediminis]|jgi:hypothetical protein|nr:hypothetical protein [Nioella sediminis]